MELLGAWDLGLPLDWRLLVAFGAIFLASFGKGVSGQGLPVIATPILALLYDLPTAMVIVTPAVVLGDIPFVVRGLPYWREARRVLPYLLAGIGGIFLGAQLLVTLHPAILATLLGSVIVVFVATAWFDVLPILSPRTARMLGPMLGFLGGVVQGSAGASASVTSMYLLSLGIPRHLFVFFINAIFQLMDSSQLLALMRLGLYTPGLTRLALLACLPLVGGMLLGFKAHKHIDDLAFRRIVLVLLSLSAISLFAKALSTL